MQPEVGSRRHFAIGNGLPLLGRSIWLFKTNVKNSHYVKVVVYLSVTLMCTFVICQFEGQPLALYISYQNHQGSGFLFSAMTNPVLWRAPALEDGDQVQVLKGELGPKGHGLCLGSPSKTRHPLCNGCL